jgi:hypothetical protein
MEVILTSVLVLLTGYTFVHPSVDNGAYTPIVLEGKMYRMNSRDGTWEICTPPTMRCVPTDPQSKSESQPEAK